MAVHGCGVDRIWRPRPSRCMFVRGRMSIFVDQALRGAKPAAATTTVLRPKGMVHASRAAMGRCARTFMAAIVIAATMILVMTQRILSLVSRGRVPSALGRGIMQHGLRQPKASASVGVELVYASHVRL